MIKTDIFQGPDDGRTLVKNDEEVQIKAFTCMINAMYRVEHKVYCNILVIMTDLADYYRCLPVVSYNLSACMLVDSIRLAQDIAKGPEKFIDCAFKLRHATLFKECAIHLAGRMTFLYLAQPGTTGVTYDTRYPEISNPAIQNLLNNMHRRIEVLLVETQQNLLNYVASNPKLLPSLATNPYGSELHRGQKFTIPMYYRTLAKNGLSWCLSPLLRSNLVLANGGEFESGSGIGYDHFYCATLSDEELPVSYPSFASYYS